VGLTGFFERRIYQHKYDTIEGFTRKYQCHRLVHYESFQRRTRSHRARETGQALAAGKEDCLD
jgi:putative endonuclease